MIIRKKDEEIAQLKNELELERLTRRALGEEVARFNNKPIQPSAMSPQEAENILNEFR